MKKTLIFAGLAAIALTACTQEEPVSENRSDVIRFLPAAGSMSRATETDNSNLSEIYVTALIGDKNYFSNLSFEKQGDTNLFTSSESYRWLGDDSQIDFYAYSPSQDALGADVEINSTTKELTSFTVADSIADQVDFITAYAAGTRSANEASGVPLTFNHQLAQIELRAKSENPTYKFEVAGMRIGRPELTGTFDFATSKWTLDDWHETGVFTSSMPPAELTATPISIMGPAGNAMLIPQTLTPWSPTGDPDNVAREAYLSVLVKITTNDGTVVYPFPSDTLKDASGKPREYAWTSIPLSGTWEAGKKYVYTLDFTYGAGNVDPDDPTPGKPVLGDAIKFTVNVTPWTETDNAINVKYVDK